MRRYAVVLMALMMAAVVMAEGKVGVVNMVDLVRFHPNRERDHKLMMETEKEYQEKLDKQRDRFEQLRDEYEKAVKEARNPALNEKAKLEAEEKAMRHRDVLAEADRDMRQEMQQLQRELGDLDARLLRQVTGEIREAVNKFAKGGNYTMIYDGTTMAYYKPELDITDAVLQSMGVDPKVRKEAAEKEAAEAAKAAAGGK